MRIKCFHYWKNRRTSTNTPGTYIHKLRIHLNFSNIYIQNTNRRSLLKSTFALQVQSTSFRIQISNLYTNRTLLYVQNTIIYWLKFPDADPYTPLVCFLLRREREREKTWKGFYLGSRHSGASQAVIYTAPILILLTQKGALKFSEALKPLTTSLLSERVLPFPCFFFSNEWLIPPRGGVHVTADKRCVQEVAYSRDHSGN